MLTLKSIEDLPNIPGIRRQHVYAKPRSHAFQMIHGKGIEAQRWPGNQPHIESYSATVQICPWSNTQHVKETNNYSDLTGRYSLHQQRMDHIDKTSKHLPFGADPQHLPRFIEYDKKTLCYHAWYKERVPESPLETERVHKCDIYYYLEDGMVHVVEHRQANSGLPQGDVLKKTLVPKPDGNGFYSDKDFSIGAEVQIFGKVFAIVDADQATRAYMVNKLGMEVPDKGLPYPSDCYTTYLKAKMQRETGADCTIPRNRRMHPMKQYMESILGKPSKMQDLGAFLVHDKHVLRFFAIWDNRETLYGDLLRFKIHYYLVDGTMEVVPQHARNSGRDEVGKLLSRAKILRPDAKNEHDYYSWADLVIGSKVLIFGKQLTVLDADVFTRDFMLQHGKPLGKGLPFPEETYPKYARPIPPYTGYGSEEDTLKNCFSFDPKPPMKDDAKAMENSGKILRYIARILTNNKDDAMRRFVILYFMEDDTIAIREPPVRNSGFAGGTFLSRTHIKKNAEERYAPYDLWIGAFVNMMGNKFEIMDADSWTLNYQETHAHEGWPRSDLLRLQNRLRSAAEDIKKDIIRVERPVGRVTYKNIFDAIKMAGFELDRQECITIVRALDPLQTESIPSSKLLKFLEGH